ncbi:MAG: PorP/SprF family type IX secretion system membrane protein [Bacteroidota bacterium]|nr:PorP/SprF family type IX secretion system membrane protein [Bacteroidota bacterium]
MKKRFIIFFLFLSGFSCAENPMFSQYYLDHMIYNPAFSGSKGYNYFSLQSRAQWLKFHERSPHTSQINYHGRFDNQSGFGLSFIFDKKSPEEETGLQVNYAYHIPLNDDRINLSFGIGATFIHHKIDFDIEDFPPDWQLDPTLRSIGLGENTSNLWDASSGIFLYADKFYLGYAINNLLESSFLDESGDKLYGNNKYKHYYLMGAYKFQIIDKDWHIEPSLLVRKLESHKEQYHITTRVIYLRDYWSAITIRTNKTLAFGIGLRLSGNLHFGYSYDHNFQSEITPLTYGTHELSISLHLQSILSQRHTSFWSY